MVLLIKTEKKTTAAAKGPSRTKYCACQNHDSALYKRLKNGAVGSHKKGNSKMAVSAQKPRPNNVPEENVYNKTHWLLIVTYMVASIAVFLLISNAG